MILVLDGKIIYFSKAANVGLGPRVLISKYREFERGQTPYRTDDESRSKVTSGKLKIRNCAPQSTTEMIIDLLANLRDCKKKVSFKKSDRCTRGKISIAARCLINEHKRNFLSEAFFWQMIIARSANCHGLHFFQGAYTYLILTRRMKLSNIGLRYFYAILECFVYVQLSSTKIARPFEWNLEFSSRPRNFFLTTRSDRANHPICVNMHHKPKLDRLANLDLNRGWFLGRWLFKTIRLRENESILHTVAVFFDLKQVPRHFKATTLDPTKFRVTFLFLSMKFSNSISAPEYPISTL